jgi:hypothetical protein
MVPRIVPVQNGDLRGRNRMRLTDAQALLLSLRAWTSKARSGRIRLVEGKNIRGEIP